MNSSTANEEEAVSYFAEKQLKTWKRVQPSAEAHHIFGEFESFTKHSSDLAEDCPERERIVYPGARMTLDLLIDEGVFKTEELKTKLQHSLATFLDGLVTCPAALVTDDNNPGKQELREANEKTIEFLLKRRNIQLIKAVLAVSPNDPASIEKVIKVLRSWE
jgi:hypothetical protein